MYEYGIGNDLQNFEKFKQLIVNSSKYIEIRLRDIQDQTLLQEGVLKPEKYEFSPIDAINEIRLILMSQLQSFNVDIIVEYE